VIVIGLTNFMVSFGMTLLITLKSRKITFFQTRQLMLLIAQHFISRPHDFFFPRKQPDMPETAKS
jgi:site-specific recombinase